jgi:hypothetical protein
LLSLPARGRCVAVTKTENGSNVKFQDGPSHTAQIIITNDAGQNRYTYCIQRRVQTRPDDGKTEVDWDHSSIANLDKVAWILNNSVPNQTVVHLTH